MSEEIFEYNLSQLGGVSTGRRAVLAPAPSRIATLALLSGSGARTAGGVGRTILRRNTDQH